MADLVTLSIDDQEISAPAGTLIVDAAKRMGNDIPVFCYHPKLDPVGMCRMCLVEVGTPMHDRETREPVMDEKGEQKIAWMPVLQTACTVPVSLGMQVRTATQKVTSARRDIIELLLTSHPLDCPICDKGGECPLQNLTMQHGPGVSRFIFDEKKQLDKHVPLGDLIFLDRERCIQCARCTRFQEEIADDPVIGFDQRGRSLQIVTFSDPGFDSYFSGNTTDICPVGALTTADFRFGARPWELEHSASICPHCSVGCNIHINTRRSGTEGGWVVKRVMPRQNEMVNEIWLCDKGRFGHHFATSPDRLNTPLVRKNGELVETSWEEALDLVTVRLRASGGDIAGLAGERLSNEDMFTFRRLVQNLGGRAAHWPGAMGGGDLVQQVGVSSGTQLSQLGAETVILVVACDLQEEAPVWWLRVKQAATKHGASLNKSRATLIVANARDTKTDRYASHKLRYSYGDEARTVLALSHAVSGDEAGLAAIIASQTNGNIAEVGRAIAGAENLIILLGGDGLGYEGSCALAQACANLLILTGHAGKPGNGLISVWPHSNTQGAWDMGLSPMGMPDPSFLAAAGVILAFGADPAGDGYELPTDAFIVVSELFNTATTQHADVVLPAQSFTEREGTYTNGERRVQRFYPALPARSQCRPDWQILAHIGESLGFGHCPTSAAEVMLEISNSVPQYAGITYQQLAKTGPQVPDVGGSDTYYGGTSFQNTTGLGLQYPTLAEQGYPTELGEVHPAGVPAGGLIAVPTTILYDRGTTLVRSSIMHPRLPEPYVELHKKDAVKLNVSDGDSVSLTVNGCETQVMACVNGRAPEGVVLVPRGLGVPIMDGIRPASVKRL